MMKEKLSIYPRFKLALVLLTLVAAGCKKADNRINSPVPDANNAAAKNNKLKINTVPSSEPLQTAANGTFFIVNKLSGKVLDVNGLQAADGSTVSQYGATGGANEKWTLKQLTGGYYSITDSNSGKALQINQAGTADGNITTIGTYASQAHQQWQFIALGNGYYRIVNRNSGKDLDVDGQSLDDLGKVQQWGYWGGDNQQWALLRVKANGKLSWTFANNNMPQDVKQRITSAMNDACARYNAGADWPARTLTVEYNTDVPTADGNSGGNGYIRFGANASYQTTRTAMHEIAHTWGVGQSGGWYNNTTSGDFTGTNTVTTIHAFETPTTAIHTGGGHFWDYGLNYDSEWSETNAFRHVKLVWAMRADGM